MKLIFHQNEDKSDTRKLLVPYIDYCKKVIRDEDYSMTEASLCLPTDKKIVTDILKLVEKKKTTDLKYNIVIGIGGSNLGTKAVYDALYGSIDNLTPDRYPKTFFLDTIDPKVITTFSHFVDAHIQKESELIISIISKSGTNTEPIVNAEVLLGSIKNRFINWKDRCVIITDTNSLMWKEGLRLGIDLLSIPKQVGGRYSVLSSVGLFPLAIANIDIKLLLKGAEEMRDICMENSSENYALNSSVFQFLFWKQGKSIHNSFYFHPELESLGKWYRQLMGESIGKVQKGITPIVSIGSVDHHSMVQLYWGGPTDKTTEIVYSQKSQDCIIPTEQLFPSLSTTNGKNTSEIVTAIQKGTTLTYEKQKQPYFEVVLNEINEYELGAYMQYKMIEILYLAQLMNINAFDQPQVELYKTETRKILANK